MSEARGPESRSGRKDEAEPEWRRRRRLASVFGEVLPDTTDDERDPDPTPDDDARDRWLRGQVPPHHG